MTVKISNVYEEGKNNLFLVRARKIAASRKKLLRSYRDFR